MDAQPELLETIDDGIATLTFNRPERMNALSTPIMEGLLHGLPRLAGDPAVKAVVLTGADRAFCAGGDVKSMAEDGGQHLQPNAARRQVVHQVNEVAYVPAQAVEFPDDECVTAPQRLAAVGKSRPVVAPAGSLVFIEARVGDAGDEQRIALGSSAWEPSAFEARVYPISTCACSLNGRLRDAPAAVTGVKPLAQPVTQSTSCKPRFRNDYGAPVPPGCR